MERATIISKVCSAVLAGDNDRAERLIRDGYPFQKESRFLRKITREQSLQIFVRDGFLNRYTGDRLVFPGILLFISTFLPTIFPFQSNWKMSETHIAYYELTPTIDHIVPIARGGLDDETNWVTTSMRSNSIKAIYTLEELGWKLLPPGNVQVWDGLMGMFIQLMEKKNRQQADEKQEAVLSGWYRLAKKAIEKF